jgi:hypothetical protein
MRSRDGQEEDSLPRSAPEVHRQDPMCESKTGRVSFTQRPPSESLAGPDGVARSKGSNDS